MMNFNPPPPQDVIQAGVNAVQELTGAGGAAAEDAGTAAQQAATSAGPSTEDVLCRIKQATDTVVAAMAEILSGDLNAHLQKEREALQWSMQTKQRALKEVMAAEADLIAAQFKIAAEFKGREAGELLELLPLIREMVMIVICVIAVVVAVMIAVATMGTTPMVANIVIICAVALVVAAVATLEVTILMNITPILKGAKVVGKAALGAGSAGGAGKGALDAATQAAVITGAGQTKGMVSDFQAEALTKQAQIQRTVESIVTALSNALVGADAATSAALERVRHDMKRAIGPAVEKVVGAKEQAGQALQRAYWELLQAVRNLLMHRHY
jgi:hypothetical protein